MGGNQIGEKDIKLGPQEEFRFEVDAGKQIKIKLISGKAEVFGSEISENTELCMTDKRMAVFTWHGCVLRVSGDFASEYVSDTTPMATYLNLHLGLNTARENADANDYVATALKRGPRVLVIGAADVGKSTLTQILCNYAVRSKHTPLYVDLDVADGGMSVPGSITCTLLERPSDVAENAYPTAAPLVYSYGDLDVLKNTAHFKILLKALGKRIDLRTNQDPHLARSGILVNSFGWNGKSCTDLIIDTIQILQLNTVVVIDHERLYNELRTCFAANGNESNTQFIKVPKSSGVLTRNQDAREEMRKHKFEQYFYGSRHELYPHTSMIAANDFLLYKIGSPPVPASCLPLGTVAEDTTTKLSPVSLSDTLLHSVMAVSHAARPDDTENPVIEQPVAGYVSIIEVDMQKRKLSLLVPAQGHLPSKILVNTHLKWID